MKTIFLTFTMFAVVNCAHMFSQARYVDYGLLRTQANIAIGKPIDIRGTNMYIAGDVDYYLKENISIRTGCYYFVGNFNGDDILKMNHSAILGFNYHVPLKSNIDPYFGIQPGFMFTKVTQPVNLLEESNSATFSNNPMTVNPVFSYSLGVNYYAARFFNLFANVQYMHGSHFSDVPSVSLNELKFSFGLGYMLWVRKDHFAFRKPETK